MKSTFVFGFVFLFSHCVIAQISLPTIYDHLVKAEHSGTRKVWSDKETIEEQQAIINDYETHSIDYIGRKALAAAIAYGYCGKPEESVVIMKRYLITNADDDKTRHLLGVTELGLGNAAEAVRCLQKTWDDGAENTSLWLAMAYIRNGQIEACKQFIPNLLQEKKGNPMALDVLVLYSLEARAFDTNLFLSAVNGMTDQEILQRQDPDVGLYIRSFWRANQQSRSLAIISEAGRKNRDLIDSLLITPEWQRRIMNSYESNPAFWNSNCLLIPAIAFASNGQNEKAKVCYSAILKAKPDDKFALRGMGAVFAFGRDFETAKGYFKRAWALGDVESLKGYAYACEQTKTYDELGQLVPSLLKHKGEDLEMILLIIDYSGQIDPPDKDLFLKAIEGLPDQVLLRNPNVTKMVILGLRKFGLNERARLLEEKASQIKST